MMQISLFNQEAQSELFTAGRPVFAAGDPGNVMFAVLAGTVEIAVRGEVVETVGPGGVFGEMALVEDRPRTASAIVKTEARLVRVSRQRFLFLVQQTPFFALQLMAIMGERLRRMDEKL
jgi:CRP-like cAMP-binding protein